MYVYIYIYCTCAVRMYNMYLGMSVCMHVNPPRLKCQACDLSPKTQSRSSLGFRLRKFRGPRLDSVLKNHPDPKKGTKTTEHAPNQENPKPYKPWTPINP